MEYIPIHLINPHQRRLQNHIKTYRKIGEEYKIPENNFSITIKNIN
jgi:hypothetical protein